MNWCIHHKDRNWDNVIFSDEWTFYLKAPGRWDEWWKIKQYVMSKTKYTQNDKLLGSIFSKRKRGFILL